MTESKELQFQNTFWLLIYTKICAASDNIVS